MGLIMGHGKNLRWGLLADISICQQQQIPRKFSFLEFSDTNSGALPLLVLYFHSSNPLYNKHNIQQIHYSIYLKQSTTRSILNISFFNLTILCFRTSHARSVPHFLNKEYCEHEQCCPPEQKECQ